MTTINDFNPDFRPHKRAKKIKLRYDAKSDRAIITLPRFTSKRTALKFASNHINWLIEQRINSPKPVYLEHGSEIPILGFSKTIIHKPELPAQVDLTDDEIIVGGPLEGLSVRIENFLKKLARKKIEPLAIAMAQKTNKSFRKIYIRDTKSRWGSCSSSGNLSFSWRLIMTPPDILEYVVAHEISHLSEMNHSHNFWAIVDTLVPNALQSRKWLRKDGQALMLILK